MKTFLFIFQLSFFISAAALAERLSVHSVVNRSDGLGQMVKFNNGQVGFTQSLRKLGITSADTLRNRVVDVELSDDHQILGLVVVVGAETVSNHEYATAKLLPFQEPSPYKPTIYSSMEQVTETLNGFRRDIRNGAQCYNKSHIWVYEENYYRGTKLMKAFLFFSDDYIQRYNFPWWFHTAPFALVKINGSVRERILDAGFINYPIQFKMWTDLFMRNKFRCKVIAKYTDYSHHPGEDDCYIMKTHMYSWQPKDLEAYEMTGVEKTQFINWEIRHAYDDALIKLTQED